MSEHAVNPSSGDSSPPRSWNSFDEELGLRGPFFNEKGQNVQYPNYSFDINVSLLMNREQGVIAITPDARLRSYMKTIAQTCQDDFPKFAAFANSAIRNMELQNARKFREGEVTIAKQKIRRSNMIHQSSALDKFYEQLEAENHPSWQFIEQLRPALSEGLSPELFEEIRGNIATVSSWPRLKQIYQEQIKNYKLASGLINLTRYIIRE